MKRVTLKSLTMHNFRGEQERTTEFNPAETWICGRNGLGKTRHFDATIWLLFGKDANDRKDYEIKTRVDGEELHNVETSVTGVFDVDGETITLKRAITENWVKPRGTTERIFKGNVTECWYNETPVNVREYDKRVSDIIDATLFKMVTNPAFFVGMKWQDQREQLMQIVGTIDDGAIMAEHPEFAALLDRISGKSLADFRKELAATRRKLKVELDEIQPRIDQTQRMMPESCNVAELNARIAEYDKQIADIDNQIADASAAVRRTYQQAQAKTARVGELKLKQQEILTNANAQAKTSAIEANAERTAVDAELRTMSQELSGLNIEFKRNADASEKAVKNVAGCDATRQSLLDEWNNVNAEQYVGDDVCPHCHQPLPQEMREQALQMFNTRKAERLQAITKRGQENNKLRESYCKEHATLESAADDLAKRINTLNDAIAEKQSWMTSHPAVQAQTYTGADIPEWNTIQAEIDAIQAEPSTDNANVDTTGLQAEKRDVMAKRDAERAIVAKQDERVRLLAEIERLEKHGKDVAQQIADIEQQEFTAESIIRARVTECERRINALFTMVTFRMFDYTQDGNAFECCTPYVGGVPYGAVNTAGQVNAGLDIINALVRHYGICAPVFIDNAEGINAHIQTESQIINLVVTDDNELVVK